MLSCLVCGAGFSPTGRRGRPSCFCSDECRSVGRKEQLRAYPRERGSARVAETFQKRPRTCLMCGVSWSNLPGKGNGRLRFCSAACGAAYHQGYANPKARRLCVGCGSEMPGAAFDLTPGRGREQLCSQCEPKKGYRKVRNSVRQTVFARDGLICQLCGESTNLLDRSWGQYGPLSPSVDHIVPRKHGGSDHPTNLRTAHIACNTLRSTGTPGEQLAWAV